jgi:protein TonB
VQAQPDIRAKPNYLKNPEPVYPELARRRRQEGLVLLAVKITAQGRAERVEIKKSSGFSLLDNAAVEAVCDWEFQPARIGSLALESEIEVPVRFELTPQ